MIGRILILVMLGRVQGAWLDLFGWTNFSNSTKRGLSSEVTLTSPAGQNRTKQISLPKKKFQESTGRAPEEVRSPEELDKMFSRAKALVDLLSLGVPP